MAYNYDEPIDPQDALEHPVGMAVGHALREGSKGAILGLPAGFGVSRLLGRAGKSRARDTMIGSAVGAGLGMISGVGKAHRERESDAMQLYGYKSASLDARQAGRAYAHELVKSAFTKELAEGVGHLASGTTSGVGRLLQSLGRGTEDFAHRMDPEIAGKAIGGAGLVGLGAFGATHGRDIAAAALGAGGDPYQQQSFPYPAQF
jgi:hypothetical protein